MFRRIKTNITTMQKKSSRKLRPEQSQKRPGKEAALKPVPATDPREYPAGKLAGKVALITGGDSGIGKAVALLFAREGASVAIGYLTEKEDAVTTRSEIEAYDAECLLLKGDVGKESVCRSLVEKTVKHFGKLDIVVNNAALHWEAEALDNISTDQLLRTFHTDFFSYFWICKYALPHLKKGAAIINTASVVAYRGSPKLIDYAAAKGAVIAFTRSLSSNLVDKGIRVNAVAPGPVWTPLIASTFKKKDVASFGSDAPMGRAGMPNEIAPAYLFLASDDGSFISGQVIHPNGGEIING